MYVLYDHSFKHTFLIYQSLNLHTNDILVVNVNVRPVEILWPVSSDSDEVHEYKFFNEKNPRYI